MRKLLNCLLGEELVSKQNDKDIREALIGLVYCIVFAILLHAIMCVCG